MHTSQVSYFTSGTQITFHPTQCPVHLSVQCSQLGHTSKNANYVNCSIIFQPQFEPACIAANCQCGTSYLYIFCGAILRLLVPIYIVRVWVVKKNVLKYAAKYHKSCPMMRSQKTAARLEGTLKPVYIVIWF